MNEFEWKYERATHTLAISSSTMPDFLALFVEENGAVESIGPEEIASVLPWAEYRDEIEIIDAPNLVHVTPVAFAWMQRLLVVDVSKALIIGNSAFYSCPQLKVARMENVQIVGHSAFSQCKSLERTSGEGRNWIELRNCRHISAFAFKGCESIATVTFKKKGTRTAEDGHVIQEAGTFLEFIGEGAFAGCVKLKNISLGGKDAAVTIGENAFYKCPLPESE